MSEPEQPQVTVQQRITIKVDRRSIVVSRDQAKDLLQALIDVVCDDAGQDMIIEV